VRVYFLADFTEYRDILKEPERLQLAGWNYGFWSGGMMGLKKKEIKRMNSSSNTHEQKLERHVVLVAPEIHWNTGNIGRTCLATGTFLHLIKPLGFSLDSREVQRAGLDYWDKVKLSLWNDFDEFLSKLAPQDGEVAVFSKRGAKSFRNMPSAKRLFLVFGSETRGLAKALLDRYAGSTYYIPITAETRSLNLSTAAGIALYESLRSAEPFHGWPRIK
jgi:tRNA (cytidine/uridine-2'-O-)-methyltransferase